MYQFSSVAQLSPTVCNPMDCTSQASLSITNSWSLLKLKSIESVMPSNHLILCYPLLFLFSSIFYTIILFSNMMLQLSSGTMFYISMGVHAFSVEESCLTLDNSMDYSPPGSPVHEIFEARILEWVAISPSNKYERILKNISQN